MICLYVYYHVYIQLRVKHVGLGNVYTKLHNNLWGPISLGRIEMVYLTTHSTRYDKAPFR